MRQNHVDMDWARRLEGRCSPASVLSWEGSGRFLPKKEDSGSLAEQSCSQLGVPGERPVEAGNPGGLRTPLHPRNIPSYRN